MPNYNFDHLTVADVMRLLMTFESKIMVKVGGGSGHRLSHSFASLSTPTSIEDARYGIERHLYYIKKHQLPVSVSALNEIIKDAKQGISVARENETELREMRELNKGLMPNCASLIHALLLPRSSKKNAQS